MTTYENLTDIEADIDEQHEPRTLLRTNDDGSKFMMTEIADGAFVQWSQCATCRKVIGQCGCAGGPVEPDYIAKWRINRFAKSFSERGVEPPLPVALKQRDRQVAAVMRHLIAQGYTITPPDEIPEDVSADQDPDNLTGMDLGEGEDHLSLDRTEDELYLYRHLEIRHGIDPNTIEGDPEAIHEREHARQTEQETPEADTSSEVDAGLTAALERLRTAKEGTRDVGF